jgi:dTDP-4-dehydrorhamnose 3,5-epimerase
LGINGVTLTPLKQIHNPKGDIFHALKMSEPTFSNFGEAYFSTIHKNDIKGWKQHSKMQCNLIVPSGSVKFVCFDNNGFYETTLNKENYARLTIEPGVWFAFTGLEEENLILNLASIEHSPNEQITKELHEINYVW